MSNNLEMMSNSKYHEKLIMLFQNIPVLNAVMKNNHGESYVESLEVACIELCKINSRLTSDMIDHLWSIPFIVEVPKYATGAKELIND